MLREFKEFALRGNVVDMAVGIIVGAAFGTLATSLVNDIIMPPIGVLLGHVDFSDLYVLLKQGEPVGPYSTLQSARDAGAVTINYGAFITTVVSFLIIAIVVFLLVKGVNSLRRDEEAPAAEPTTKTCPYCLSNIPIGATRCPYCTSDLGDTSSG